MTKSSLNIGSFFITMPRNQLTKDQIKYEVLKIKRQLQFESDYHGKNLADKYLNMVLDKIDEYAR